MGSDLGGRSNVLFKFTLLCSREELLVPPPPLSLCADVHVLVIKETNRTLPGENQMVFIALLIASEVLAH